MSFEQFPQNIPEAERADMSESPVSEGEMRDAVKEVGQVNDVYDTETGSLSTKTEEMYDSSSNTFSANASTEVQQTETFSRGAEQRETRPILEPEKQPEVDLQALPEILTPAEPQILEIPEMPGEVKFKETTPPEELQRENAFADEEAEQSAKRAHEANEIERVRAELAETKEYEHEFHDGGNEPPKERNGGGGGDGGGRWERPTSTHTAYEREEVTHYKVCENCGGSGRIWFVFKCKKCNGAGEIKSGKSVSMKPYQTT